MTDSIFGTTAPGSADAADGFPINTATTFKATAPVSCTHHRFYSSIFDAGTITARLYRLTSDTTGVLLAEKAYASYTLGALNTVAWDTPVALVTGEVYRVQHHSSGGRYVFTAGALTGDVTSAGGLLVALADGSTPTSFAINNGSFDYGAVALATTGTAGLNFHDDVTVEPSGATITGSGAGSLGGLTGTASGVPERFGTGVGILGGLTGVADAGLTVQDHPRPVVGGGWWDLAAIAREAADLRRLDVLTPPDACAHCGTPLRSGPRGELYCPFEGLRY